jgi:acyl transferase domain-containing protein
MNLGENSIQSILMVMAKLFTLGVSYNPLKLSSDKPRRVALPTYPFETSEYKVSFEDESIGEYSNIEFTEGKDNPLVDKKELDTSKGILVGVTLKKLSTQETISNEKRLYSIDHLRRDLILFRI